jgi:group I intron endonuclease
MDYGCIYLITCKANDKKYVGQHQNANPYHRWQQHISDSKRDTKNPFHQALRQYGKDGFTWEVIYTGPRETLSHKEGYFAELYESYVWLFPGGYNAQTCGNGKYGGGKKLSALELSLQRRQSLLNNIGEINDFNETYEGLILD